MRLDELYNVEKKHRDLDTHHMPNRSMKSMRGELGAGHFSSVKPVKHDPHLVQKQNLAPRKKLTEYDAYWAYVDFIVDNDMAQKNPYFPRIYGVTSVADKSSREAKRAKMERLIALNDDSVSAEEIYAVYEKMFKRAIFHSTSDFAQSDAAGSLSMMVNAALEHQEYGDIRDESFLEFAKIFRKFCQDCKNDPNRQYMHMIIDIKTSNLMFRRTAHGLQLVITDPIA